MPSKKKLLICSLFLALLGAAVWALFHTGSRSSRKYVFVITIDTLRADHLGCYGYPRDTSPFLDSLAARGVVFDNAVSQSATTCPSHASIFTGLYPSQHRVLANGNVIDDSVTTLAEILGEKGVCTAAFTSTDRHFLRSGIHRGFSFYEEPVDTALTYKLHYRPAEQTIDHAAIWLANFDPAKDLLMWIHVFDPHQPFRKVEEFYQKVDIPEKKASLLEFLKKRQINMEIFNNDPEDLYRYITLYDSEIRYVDAHLERLFRLIESKDMLDKSYWIITADHGESLGQHNWLGHAKPLYQEDIHVPLIFFDGSGKASKGIREKRLVENFNIFPTVLDLFRIEPANSVKKEMQAVSLLPLGTGEVEAKAKEFVLSERQHYNSLPDYAPEVPFWRRDWEDGEKFSIQFKGWKYIHRTTSDDELYNLIEDPLELNNRIEEKKGVAEYPVLLGTMTKMLQIFEGYRGKKVKLIDEQAIKRLRALGYL